MEAYLAFMRRKDRRTAAKLFTACAFALILCCTVAYLNTRFNGFADVHPAAYYFHKLRQAWQSICDTLFLYPDRFINFFN